MKVIIEEIIFWNPNGDPKNRYKRTRLTRGAIDCPDVLMMHADVGRELTVNGDGTSIVNQAKRPARRQVMILAVRTAMLTKDDTGREPSQDFSEIGMILDVMDLALHEAVEKEENKQAMIASERIGSAYSGYEAWCEREGIKP